MIGAVEEMRPTFSLVENILEKSVKADKPNEWMAAVNMVGQAYDIASRASVFSKDTTRFTTWYESNKADFVYCLNVARKLLKNMKRTHADEFEPGEYNNVKILIDVMTSFIVNSEKKEPTPSPVASTDVQHKALKGLLALNGISYNDLAREAFRVDGVPQRYPKCKDLTSEQAAIIVRYGNGLYRDKL
jgi:hypothetical protein